MATEPVSRSRATDVPKRALAVGVARSNHWSGDHTPNTRVYVLWGEEREERHDTGMQDDKWGQTTHCTRPTDESPLTGMPGAPAINIVPLGPPIATSEPNRPPFRPSGAVNAGMSSQAYIFSM